MNWAGMGLIVAVSTLLCAVATSARVTAIVLSGGMLIESRAGSAGTKHVLSGGSSATGAKEGIDLGAVGGSQLVRIAVGRSIMMGGSPLLR